MDGTKADEIALALEEAIVSGELEPGTVLRQEQVSSQYAVSRTPFALRRVLACETKSASSCGFETLPAFGKTCFGRLG